MDYFSKHTYSLPPPAATPLIMDIDMDDDESLDEYFDNYVPLSNLPTPPPLSISNSPPLLHSYSDTDAHLLSPATYLANLIPPSASASRPSIATIVDYLAQANLPSQTLALAACILDSLSSSFPRSWRAALTAASSSTSFPTPSSPSTSTSTSTSSATSPPPPPPPAPSSSGRAATTVVRPPSWGLFVAVAPPPELLVLAALKIAAGFLEDERRGGRWWAECVAQGQVSERQLEGTVRSVLRDVEYDLCGIAAMEAVERKRRAMFRGQ